MGGMISVLRHDDVHSKGSVIDGDVCRKTSNRRNFGIFLTKLSKIVQN